MCVIEKHHSNIFFALHSCLSELDILNKREFEKKSIYRPMLFTCPTSFIPVSFYWRFRRGFYKVTNLQTSLNMTQQNMGISMSMFLKEVILEGGKREER